MSNVKMTTKRINIVISDRINSMLDELGEVYGVSKSALAALAIGQYVEAMSKQREAVYGNDGLMQTISKRIMEEATKQQIS